MTFDRPHINGFKLFCDLDGVLTDIEASFRVLHPRFDQIPKSRVWEVVERAGVPFWETLPWTGDGKRLWRFIESYGPRILTAAPNRNPKLFADSRKGKILWIRRELGADYADRAIVCRRNEKSDAAAAGHILIDDYPSTIKKWRSAGGIGILHVCAEQTIDSLKGLVDGAGATEPIDRMRPGKNTTRLERNANG